MKKYQVALSRAYVVTIEAENKEKACRFAEYYLGDCFDASGLIDTQTNNFSIIEIVPTINDAIYVEEVKNHESKS